MLVEVEIEVTTTIATYQIKTLRQQQAAAPANATAKLQT
jgi:hypothetical protein